MFSQLSLPFLFFLLEEIETLHQIDDLLHWAFSGVNWLENLILGGAGPELKCILKSSGSYHNNDEVGRDKGKLKLQYTVHSPHPPHTN